MRIRDGSAAPDERVTTVMDRRRKRPIILLMAGLVPVLVGVLVSGCAVAEWEEPPPLSVTQMVPVLGEPQESFDVMPAAMLQNIQSEMDPQSVRYLGVGDGNEYWVAKRRDVPGVCFFTVFNVQASNGDSAAGGCIDARSFYDNGLRNADNGRGGILISSDVDTSPVTKQLAEHLIPIVGPDGMSPARASSHDKTRLIGSDVVGESSVLFELPRSSGEAMVFNL